MTPTYDRIYYIQIHHYTEYPKSLVNIVMYLHVHTVCDSLCIWVNLVSVCILVPA